MKSIDEMKSLWEHNKGKEGKPEPLDQQRMLSVIRLRAKKEKRTIVQYVVASWVWQFTVYALLVNMIVRFWGDWKSVFACFVGIGVYAQFTVKYARFCSNALKSVGKRVSTVEVLSENVKYQHDNLLEFFNFKKKFDMVGIPVIGIVIVMIFSYFEILPGLDLNPAPVILFFALIQTIFIMATNVGDKKQFIIPLERMEGILKELTTEF